jgi:hypothetical protein
MTGERGADDLRNGIGGLDHQPGTCRPSCSPECYRAKLRSLAFTLPASFRAARPPVPHPGTASVARGAGLEEPVKV